MPILIIISNLRNLLVHLSNSVLCVYGNKHSRIFYLGPLKKLDFRMLRHCPISVSPCKCCYLD